MVWFYDNPKMMRRLSNITVFRYQPSTPSTPFLRLPLIDTIMSQPSQITKLIVQTLDHSYDLYLDTEDGHIYLEEITESRIWNPTRESCTFISSAASEFQLVSSGGYLSVDKEGTTVTVSGTPSSSSSLIKKEWNSYLIKKDTEEITIWYGETHFVSISHLIGRDLEKNPYLVLSGIDDVYDNVTTVPPIVFTELYLCKSCDMMFSFNTSRICHACSCGESSM